MRLYRASQFDCEACALKAKCCPGQLRRKVPRSVHEAAREVARSFAGTPEYLQSRRERKKVEMLFAHLKRILRLFGPREGGDAGYTGADKRPENADREVSWNIAFSSCRWQYTRYESIDARHHCDMGDK